MREFGHPPVPVVLVPRVALAVADVGGREFPAPAHDGFRVRGVEDRLIGGGDGAALVEVGPQVSRGVVGGERVIVGLRNRAVLVVVAGREQEGHTVRPVLVPLLDRAAVVEDRADIRPPVLRVVMA